MKKIIHKAETRGSSDYGWLKTHYTFSFANYYDSGRMHFGALRVLNDDFIERGAGFWETESISLSALEDAEILVMEVPMRI
jgi:redox-sensitive bicupin YhaK (pirin superfamily)